MLIPELIENRTAQAYYKKDGVVVGLTPKEAALARENGINLGHCSYPGDDGHNEFHVAKAVDRESLESLFNN